MSAPDRAGRTGTACNCNPMWNPWSLIGILVDPAVRDPIGKYVGVYNKR